MKVVKKYLLFFEYIDTFKTAFLITRSKGFGS